MQRVVYVILQLDEAGRFIRDGRLEHLRVALLLLDNAAELQLDRKIQERLMHERFREKLRHTILQLPRDRVSGTLSDLLAWQPLSKDDKRKLDRTFDEKVKQLADRWNELDRRLAGPLIYLHRYRNEAYHRARVRPATIRTAALLLLEINCILLLTLKLGMTIISSGEDYSWLEERFGVNAHAFLGDQPTLERIVEAVRGDMLPSTEAVTGTLVKHLNSRFEELYDALDFIVQNTEVNDRPEAFRRSQYALAIHAGHIAPSFSALAEYRPSVDFDSLAKLEARIAEIASAPDRVEAFNRFARIEAELEPIEAPVHRGAAEIDEQIQAEIDRRRGK